MNKKQLTLIAVLTIILGSKAKAISLFGLIATVVIALAIGGGLIVVHKKAATKIEAVRAAREAALSNALSYASLKLPELLERSVYLSNAAAWGESNLPDAWITGMPQDERGRIILDDSRLLEYFQSVQTYRVWFSYDNVSWQPVVVADPMPYDGPGMQQRLFELATIESKLGLRQTFYQARVE